MVLSRTAGGVGDTLSRSGPSPRGETLGEEKKIPREGKTLARLARLESLALSENHPKDLVGPGRPARGTLVSTVPTVCFFMDWKEYVFLLFFSFFLNLKFQSK